MLAGRYARAGRKKERATGSYTALTGYSGPQTNNTGVSATEGSEFYRLKITYP